ncbi:MULTISPECIES: DUF4402 domain-containing protein [unclassified Novosphingobium]|uniref:DUF4402 domain-containing protein n=1 Tax=unclassified Novosphingobium TaxID=2644732 RepID=UPI00146EA3B9|nr:MULTISPECIES: DUF4402 domain-containing protein [unclassified Novosphingobium]NMN06517.1 hypothetical protein [Novosphingobium sp. SG919]NMN89035.1 hypothetical protein [Novosphingobium sp. SG916]
MAVLALPGSAQAAQANTATGEAQARVVAALSVDALDALDFGVVVGRATTGGTVAVDPAGGAPRYGGGAIAACGAGVPCAAAHPARFAVHGEAGRVYLVSVPESLVVSGDGQGPVLTVDALAVLAHTPGPTGNAGLLDAQGADTFSVGGTLNVPADAPAARYRLTIPLIVTYG